MKIFEQNKILFFGRPRAQGIWVAILDVKNRGQPFYPGTLEEAKKAIQDEDVGLLVFGGWTGDAGDHDSLDQLTAARSLAEQPMVVVCVCSGNSRIEGAD